MENAGHGLTSCTVFYQNRGGMVKAAFLHQFLTTRGSWQHVFVSECLLEGEIYALQWSKEKWSLEWAISLFSCMLNQYQALTHLLTWLPVEADIVDSSTWPVLIVIYTHFFFYYLFEDIWFKCIHWDDTSRTIRYHFSCIAMFFI